MIADERYFHGTDVAQAEFYQLQSVLLDSQKYISLSNDSRVLYAVLHKRLQLSLKNKWLDKDGRTFFYYTREEMADKIHVSLKTGRKAVKELIDAELLHEARQGRGLPNRLYLLKPELSAGTYSGPEPRFQNDDDSKTGKSCQSRVANITSQDRQILPPKKNDKSNNDNSLYPSSSSPLNATDERLTEDGVRMRIEYHSFTGEDLRIVDDIVTICLKVDTCKSRTLRIGGTWIDSRQAKEAFSRIDKAAVEHTIAAVKSANEIIHFRSYVESVLYNYLSTPAAASSQKQPQKPRNTFCDFSQRNYSDDLLKQIMEAQK